MRTFRRADRAVPIALLLLLATILIACAGSGAGRLDDDGQNLVPGAGQAGAGSGDDGTGTPAEAPASSGSDNPDAVGAIDDAKIIRTGTMDLEVSDVPGAIRAARDAIRGMGGYIGASRTSNVDDKPYAEITYRIPVERWEDALDALRSLNGMTAKVVTEQTEAVDVTGQVVDLEARIRNLKVSEIALQGIAEQATRIPDILEIQAQISNVRGQIEQLEAQRNALADQTTYATLTVSYQLPVVAAVAVQAEGWDPAAIFDEATASIVSVFQALAGAGIWLVVVWVPILVMVSIVAGIVLWLLRRFGVFERSLRPTPPAPSGD